MSNLSMTSSLPRTEVLGFKDDSGQGQPLETASLPIYLPLYFLNTAWGPENDALLVGGAGFNSIYGAESLDPAKAFCSHQSVLASQTLDLANMAFIRRLVPADASIARLRLWIDLLADDIVQYKRGPDGAYERDNAGALIDLGTTVAGHRARFVVEAIPTTPTDDFAAAATKEGTMVSGTGAKSTMYPLLDFEGRFTGSRGNNLGFRLVAPTLQSNTPIDADLVTSQGAYLYRFYALSRANANSSASVLTNMDGQQYVEFSFKAGFTDPATNANYFIDDVLLPSYEAENPDDFTGYGPFKRVHVYQANLTTVLNAIYTEEANFGLVTADQTPEQAINLLGGLSVEGLPYYSYEVVGPSGGGVLFSESSSFWLQGGSDGTLNNDVYDAAVASELDTFGASTVNYADDAKYPFSAVVDTGWKLDTKKKLVNVLNVNPACFVVASTQDVSQPLNTPAEDSSTGIALRAALRLAPESEYYGTSTCRAVVLKNAGKYLYSTYKGILPFTVSFGVKCASYMGGADGFMVNGKEFDSEPNNIVKDFINHNAVTLPVTARNRDWQNGLVGAQSFDYRSVFWAAIQTVYDDNTSVLNSFFNMVICCNLTRIGQVAWRRFTGNSKLTAQQRIEQIDEFIAEQVKDKYDSRATITPKSYYTAADTQRGYSWHTDITMAASGMPTVETLTVVAQRRDGEAA